MNILLKYKELKISNEENKWRVNEHTLLFEHVNILSFNTQFNKRKEVKQAKKKRRKMSENLDSEPDIHFRNRLQDASESFVETNCLNLFVDLRGRELISSRLV